MDLKHRRPIPHYLNDRALLMSRHRAGVRLNDDPTALERLQGGDFIDTKGGLTEKGLAAVAEIERLAVERGTPSPRFPVDA